MITRLHIKVFCPYRCLSNPSSGPQGVHGRLPGHSNTKSSENSTGLAITDPFTLYQTYIRLGKLEKDQAQLRVMKEFQKLHYRVRDYRPPQDLAIRTSLLLRKLEIKHARECQIEGTRLGATFNRFKNIFTQDFDSQKKELVRSMTDEEELSVIAAPQGLLVNGEVGCGKSLCMDIFASTLPHDSKMRWHYSNFMLWVFAEIHNIQQQRNLLTNLQGKQKLTMENEFILFEIAQKMINRSTIFMLDEFMLPDVASAQIVRILFTYYFKLGGVLVATSNKLPEELYSSEFNKSRFKTFEGILKARCIGVDMKSTTDYRLLSASKSSGIQNLVVKGPNNDHEMLWEDLLKHHALKLGNDLNSPAMKTTLQEIEFQPDNLYVYNRRTLIPKTYNNKTVCYLEFDYICRGLFSSSDYITLASTYQVVIIDNVPVMTTKMKNEARRFITLLDALYEARCQLFLRCDDHVENLFFPNEDIGDDKKDNAEAVQEEEMFAKTAIATTNPYRPNISSYDQDYAKHFDDRETSHSGKVDFQDTKAFTGEDEKFAFRRAILRIVEMVGSDEWRNVDQWTPTHQSMRPWESSRPVTVLPTENKEAVEPQQSNLHSELTPRKVKMTLQHLLPKDLSNTLGMSFRTFNRRFAPKFNRTQHFWALGTWTAQQRKKVKDKIARSWISGGVRDK